MKEETLREIVREKINTRTCRKCGTETYDGFDMSGYNATVYENIEILSRFRNYMHPQNDPDWRDPGFIFPQFWKGCGLILKTSYQQNKTETLKEVSGWSTEKIILEIIKLQNPNILQE